MKNTALYYHKAR